MTVATAPTPRRIPPWVARAGVVLLALLATLMLVLLFFPWDVLREPLNRYVSEKTGRKFEIVRKLDVRPGWRGATIEFDGIEFANPSWAREAYLVKAQRAEFEIRLWPLVRGEVVIPRLQLVSPTVGLQLEEDGRRTWALGKEGTGDKGTVPTIGLLQIDGGGVDFLAQHLGVDLHVDFTFDTARGEMPLEFQIKGRYQRQPLTAQGRTGNVLQLTSSAGQPPFPLEIKAAAGKTQFAASGTVAALADLDGIDAKFRVKGQTLGDLYPLLGIALPQTSPYALSGNLSKRGKIWDANGLNGKLGLSDISGDMRFDQSAKLPQLAGNLRSRVMDMDDLGPLIGLPPTARSASAIEGVEAPASITQVKRAQRDPGRKVLPTATLDFERLRAMNADVQYTADKIRNVREVPLDRGSVHVKLVDGVLTLDPLDLGVASGKLAGAIRIDATQNPADIRASLDIRAVQLNRLIPKVETLKTSFGKLDGRINLSGRGEFSNLLLEFMGLDGGEVIKFLLEGDHNVTLRCAAVAFDVSKGVMVGRSMVFDTTDTVFNATGQASLADETMNFVIRQQPKDMSILSLRTPLVISGTFGSPSAGIEAGPLAGRGLAALALGIVNPLLALAATIETGPGLDADCKSVLADANKPSTGAAAAGAAKGKSARQ